MKTEFMKKVAERESSNNKKAINQFGFLGLYQMGRMALIDAGVIVNDKKMTKNDYKNYVWTPNIWKITNYEQFLEFEEAQDQAVLAYHKKLWGYIKSYKLDRFIDWNIEGVWITKSGLIAGCHLVGIGSLKKYLNKQTQEPPKDGNGVSCLEYMKKFANLDVGF